MSDKLQTSLAESGFAHRTADDAIHFERLIHAPIERVWDALTTENGLRAWIGPAQVELRVGGTFTPALGEDVEMRGHVLELQPPHRLLIFWREISQGRPTEYGTTPDFHSELLFTLAPVDEGTKLTLTHRLIRGGDVMTSFAGVWHAFLDRLDAAVRGEPAIDAMAIYEKMKPIYDQRFAATS
jgi:uncharacterized protein YndB with AHSA1/START domain